MPPFVPEVVLRYRAVTAHHVMAAVFVLSETSLRVATKRGLSTGAPSLGHPTSHLQRHCCAHKHQRIVAKASVTHSNSCDSKKHKHRTYERVLRYPDGNVRYIRYPAADTLSESRDEEEDEAAYTAWDVTGLWSMSSSRPRLVGSSQPKRASSRRYQEQDISSAHSPSQVCLHRRLFAHGTICQQFGLNLTTYHRCLIG